MPSTIACELISQLKYAAKSTEDYPKTGVIFGVKSETSQALISVSAAKDENLLPAGFSVTGAYSIDPQADLDSLKPPTKSKGKKKPFVLLHVTDGFEVVAYTVANDGSLAVDEIVQVNAKSIFNDLFTISIEGSTSITFQDKDSIADVLKSWEKSANKTKFALQESSLVFEAKGIGGNTTDLYGYIEDAETQALDEVAAPEKLKKQQREKLKKKKIEAHSPLKFQLNSNEVPADKGDHMHSFGEELTVPLQVTLFVNGSLSSIELHKLMVKVIKDEITLLAHYIENNCTEDKFPHVRVFQYFPQPFGNHLISAVYPDNLSDEALQEERKKLHLAHLLPLDRPLVTRENKFVIGRLSPSGHLINPHEGLSSGVTSPNIQAVVQGCYLYHHYMQDAYDDNGWGCAYRSLQTLVSWFNLQGYISATYPSHSQIQQALIDCGDKEANFLGTRRWIGSQEVSYVLNQLYGITSKIMFVSSGSDLANKGRELVAHFQTQGTPIMVGGGVLAHTILGVDLNEKSGLIKFLILDPHYTGSEDLETVQKKGWCGWKGANFWEKNSFYNLCMPQRPVKY